MQRPTQQDLIAAHWRKSSYSASGDNSCLEVAEGFTRCQPVRDSKRPEGAAVTFSASAWSAFVAAVRREELGGC